MSDDESSTNSEDEAMKAKIAAFMEGTDWDDESEEEEEDEEDEDDLKQLDIPDDLPEKHIDRLILGANDIVKGRKVFEELTGLKCDQINQLRGGAGTKSVTVALDKNTYIEIMAPDGSGRFEDGTPGQLKEIPDGELVAFHYTVRSTPEAIRTMVPDSSWAVDHITMVGSGTPTVFDEGGSSYAWDIVHLYGHKLGGCVPSFVHWRDNKAHPTARLEDQGAKLRKVIVRVPEGDHVRGLLETLEGIKIADGKAKLQFEIETPNGAVKFKGTKPAGVVMPGFNDDNHESYNKAAAAAGED